MDVQEEGIKQSRYKTAALFPGRMRAQTARRRTTGKSFLKKFHGKQRRLSGSLFSLRQAGPSVPVPKEKRHEKQTAYL